jgi:hypothetical protein
MDELCRDMQFPPTGDGAFSGPFPGRSSQAASSKTPFDSHIDPVLLNLSSTDSISLTSPSTLSDTITTPIVSTAPSATSSDIGGDTSSAKRKRERRETVSQVSSSKKSKAKAKANTQEVIDMDESTEKVLAQSETFMIALNPLQHAVRMFLADLPPNSPQFIKDEGVRALKADINLASVYVAIPDSEKQTRLNLMKDYVSTWLDDPSVEIDSDAEIDLIN